MEHASCGCRLCLDAMVRGPRQGHRNVFGVRCDPVPLPPLMLAR